MTVLTVSRNYRDVSHLDPRYQMRLYDPCRRNLHRYYDETFLLYFPHMLFLRIPVDTADSERKIKGTMLFVGVSVDSEVSAILPIPVQEVWNYHACLGWDKHFLYPVYSTLGELITLFWNTAGHIVYADWLKCKSVADALKICEYGHRDSSIAQCPRISLKDFVVIAEAHARDHTRWR